MSPVTIRDMPKRRKAKGRRPSKAKAKGGKTAPTLPAQRSGRGNRNTPERAEAKGEEFNPGGRPTKLTEEVLAKAEGFFDHVGKHPIRKNVIFQGVVSEVEIEAPPTLDGLALYLRITRQTLHNWCNAEGALNARIFDLVNEVRLRYSEYLTRNGLVENINPRFSAFLASADLDKREKSDLTSGEKPIASLTLTHMTDAQLAELAGGDGGTGKA